MEKEISYPYNVISFSLYVSTFFPYQLAIFFFFSKKHDFILLNLTVKLCSTVSVQTISTCPLFACITMHISSHHSQPSIPHCTASLHLSLPVHFLFVCLWPSMSAGGFHATLPFPKQTPALPHSPPSDVDAPSWEKQKRRTVFWQKGVEGRKKEGERNRGILWCLETQSVLFIWTAAKKLHTTLC